MKIYIHEGKGFYIGSLVVVVTDSLQKAEILIRKRLDNMGLSSEALSITEKDIINDVVVYEQNGDY